MPRSLNCQSRQNIVVLKFGSSILTTKDDLAVAGHEIYRHLRNGDRVIAIVSALGNTTNTLLDDANSFLENPTPAALAAHLATGEQQSVTLLRLALERAGIPARTTSPYELNLQTTGPTLNARPSTVNETHLLNLLQQTPVLILPGFVGIDQESHETTLLGRGGSDLSAVFIAHAIQAKRCILYKDVEGLYEFDPKLTDENKNTPPRRFKSIAWEDALRLDDSIIQAKAVLFAFRHAFQFEIAGLNQNDSTIVGKVPTQFAPSINNNQQPKTLRIALLGLGTVGLGVYQHIIKHPTQFQITGILVQNPKQHLQNLSPSHHKLLTTNPDDIFANKSDIIIEAIGGTTLAHDLLKRALDQNIHVITANKDLISTAGPALRKQAKAHNCQLHYSATTAGAIPILETIRAHRANPKNPPITKIEAVINGTTNFILDQLSIGTPFADALQKAQDKGFAEADPTADLQGIDAAHKICIIAHAAFDQELTVNQLDECTGITRLDLKQIKTAASRNRTIRLVASCTTHPHGKLETKVQPVYLPSSHPLAQCTAENNTVIIHTENQSQPIILTGKGAGRYPTAQSVFADLQTLQRNLQQTSRATPPSSFPRSLVEAEAGIHED